MSGRLLRAGLIGALLGALVAALPVAAHENSVVHRGMGHWSVDILGNPFYTPAFRTEIGNGSEQEDVPATRSLGHFYNPETNSAPWFALGSGPATQNSQDQYNAAISAYMANNLIGTDAAFHRMGRALHFVQDMTSPAHTHDDDHATGDDFEGFGPGTFPSMNFSTVTPKYATPPTADGFVREIGRLIYDQTVYQAVIHEDESTQPNSVFRQMFPTLHFESGGFFTDDHFEIDRIGDWGCDLLCADDWWIPDELLSTDNGGPGGSVRHSGSAYVENTGGDGGPVIPVVFGGVPNSANESLLQIYARLFYPEAIAYGAGLLQVFADAVGAPLPTATTTNTPTITATATLASTATATHTASGTPTNTLVPTATRTASFTVTATPSNTGTSTFTATRTATRTWTASATVTATPTPSVTATSSATPSVTPTPTATPLCAATPRSDCTAPLFPERAKFQMRDGEPGFRDKLLWRWSKGNASLSQFGTPQSTTEYALCIYDSVAGVPGLVQSASVPPGGTCAGVPCWKPLSRGFKYKNLSGTPDGLTQVLLKEGQEGRAKFIVKGKGAELAFPTPLSLAQHRAQDPAVTVQLVNSVGFCWDATFSAPAQRNDAGGFKDKSD